MVTNRLCWEKLLNKFIALFIILLTFSGCGLSVTQTDNTTYSEMVEYGANYIKSRGSSDDVIVEDRGDSISATIINNPDTSSSNWYLKESLVIESMGYNSYISNNSKAVLLVKSN